MAFQPEDFLVWGEIPVSDLEESLRFYSTVTGAELEVEKGGPNPVVMIQPSDKAKGVGLHLYPGKPAQDGNGPTLHLAAEGTLEQVMLRVTNAGGQVISDPIQIPAGRFFYAKDPDGNSVGFFAE